MGSHLNNLAVSLSITANAIVAGKRYEMLSSRAYRCDWWFTALIIDWAFEWFGVLDHCEMCYEQQERDGIYNLRNAA